MDFYLFCLVRYWRVISYLPAQLSAFLRYQLRLISKKAFKEGFLVFLRGLESPSAVAVDFWKKNRKKIYPWYLNQKQPDDVVISASPEFLLAPICAELGIKHLIATQVSSNGTISGENCRSEEKVVRFRELFGNAVIEQFYSDSLSDIPMAELSQKPFFVRGGKRTKWELGIIEPSHNRPPDCHS